MELISAYNICVTGNRSKEPEFVRIKEMDFMVQEYQRELSTHIQTIMELEIEIEILKLDAR